MVTMNSKSGEGCLEAVFGLFAAIGAIFSLFALIVVIATASADKKKPEAKAKAEAEAIVFEESVPEVKTPESQPYDRIAKGQHLYYITYSYDGLIMGSTNIIMDKPVSEWAHIYGTNSLMSRLLSSGDKKFVDKEITIVNFQCIALRRK